MVAAIVDVEVGNFLNLRSATDQRVLELLQDNFHLFDGVFDASDQVLGRIEAEIDFEKRINEIYDCCHTPQEIASLRAELDADSPDGRARRANMGQAGKDRCKPAIEIIGELAALISRIKARKTGYKVRSTRLIVTENGTSMLAAMLRGRFDLARKAAGADKKLFQLRDLRAKASTDKAESSGDIMQAQDHFGHTAVAITEQYIRERKG
ncbi:MAG: tyrosine-type recombinase/integrase [Pseudomonas sp.]